MPIAVADDWAWSVVKSMLLDSATAALAAGRSFTAPSGDPEAARLAHESSERALLALLAAEVGGALKPYLEQATREERRLRGIVAELEKRQAESARQAGGLRRLCERARGGVGELTFDERRLALEALGFKMFANSDNQIHWRHESSI